MKRKRLESRVPDQLQSRDGIRHERLTSRTAPKPDRFGLGRVAEQSIFRHLAWLGAFVFTMLIFQMWTVQKNGDIPDRYIDQWAASRVDLLQRTGCLRIDYTRTEPWVEIDGLKDGKGCSSLKRFPDGEVKQKVQRVYRDERRFLTDLDRTIERERRFSRNEGAPPTPLRWINLPGNDDINPSTWILGPGVAGTELETTIKAKREEITQFKLNHRFRLSGPRELSKTRKELQEWIEQQQVIPMLSFINPFFVRDPAILDRLQSTPRGFIFDRKHTLLIHNLPAPEGEPITRKYPGGAPFFSLLGVDSPGEGGFGLEASLSSILFPVKDGNQPCATDDSVRRGCDVTLTVDKQLTDAVYNTFRSVTGPDEQRRLLQPFRDAWRAMPEDEQAQLIAVLLDVPSGGVLVSTQFPAADPEDSQTWSRAVRKHLALTEHIFPGSTFKPVTALAGMSVTNSDGRPIIVPSEVNGLPNDAPWYPTECMKSRPIIQGNRNYKSLPFDTALIHSKNQYFARVAFNVESAATDGFGGTLDTIAAFSDFRLGSTNSLIPPLPIAANILERDLECPANSVTRAGFGQGVVRVSPLYMAYIALAIASGGNPPQAPGLVDSLGRWTPPKRTGRYGGTGRWLTNYRDDSYLKPRLLFTGQAARDVGALMCQVAETGTAKKSFSMRGTAQFPIPVAIKTGTAEHEKERQAKHDLSVIGFYPADNPKVAFYIGVRQIRPPRDGGGFLSSDVLAPVAREVILATLDPLGIDPANSRGTCPPRPAPTP